MSIQNNTTGLSTLKDLINALPEYIDTTGTAEAADIYSGKTATVGGVKLTGTNPYNADNVDPAVADAITALTDKGVDATGAGLADLAGLIAGIESGGITYFTFTPAATGVLWNYIDYELTQKILCIFWTRIDKFPNLASNDSTDGNTDQYEAHSGVTYPQGFATGAIQTVTTNFNAASGWWNPSSASVNVGVSDAVSSEAYYGGAVVNQMTSSDNLSFYVANTGEKGLRVGGTYLVCFIEKGW